MHWPDRWTAAHAETVRDMDLAQLASLRSELHRFARHFDACIRTCCSRRHLRTYLGGQLGDLPRKSVEPIALQAGVAPRTLQQFLSLHRWDEEAMRDRLQERVAARHAHAEAIGVVDETASPKKGDKTPGVQRQHCGATGKTDNCIVTVHLGYVAGRFHALLDGDLYLPRSWAEDRERCRAAGIPDEVGYRPKWQIALEQIEGAVERGVRLKWLCADEFYGRAYAFRLGAADLGLRYVVEVPCDLLGWTASRLGDRKPRRMDRCARGGRWELWRVKDTQKGPAVWKVRTVRFHPREEGVAGEEQWLIVARNVLTGETKYFLSNAPADTPVGTLLHVAFARWHIERIFREAKNETGLDHFEGRRYLGLRRHLVLTALSLLFLAEQKQRLGADAEKKGSPSRSSRSSAPSRSSSIATSPLASAAGS